MSDVYRAEDQKLGRAVAIKLIRSENATAPSRLARLEREARALAALNHPNVATLHGYETDVEHHFLVMELVPGETLHSRLGRGSLPFSEVVTIARQIAEALEAAHAIGVIHRDLKPANVMITPEGRAKVLDFGLARPVSATRDGVTVEGAILGTPAYMSPEQARGEVVDKRTDVWAFGCVLFELVCGNRAFGGKTVVDIIATVLTHEPDWSQLPAQTPPRLRALLQKLLRKNPHNRLHDIADARIELDDALTANDPPVSPANRPTRRATLLGLAGAGVTAAGAFAAGWWGRPRPQVQQLSPSNETPVSAPESPEGWEAPELVLAGTEGENWPIISPDGQWLAYILFVGKQTQVGVLDLKTGNRQVLSTEENEGIVLNMCWSRDSRRVYYARHVGAPTGVYSKGLLDGSAEKREIKDAGSPQILPDGSLLVGEYDKGTHRFQIVRLWPGDGTRRVYPLAMPLLLGGSGFVALPDGREVAMWHRPADAPPNSPLVLALLDLETEKIRVLSRDIQPGIYGHFLHGGDNRMVYAVTAGLHTDSRVIAVPRESGGAKQTVFAPPATINGGSFAPDGSLYVSIWQETDELLRFHPAKGGAPERLGSAAGLGVLELPDGRILSTDHTLGRWCVMVRTPARDGKPGNPPVPFMRQFEEPTALPGVVIDKEVLLLVGESERINPAIVNSNGQITYRFTHVRLPELPRSITSRDGKTVYYAMNDIVWGASRQRNVEPWLVCEGRTAALLDNQTLLVTREQADGIQLWRVALQPDGKPVRAEGEHLPFTTAKGAGKLWLNDFYPLEGAAVSGPDHTEKRIPILTMAGNSYFNIVALFDVAKRELAAVPLDYHGDVFNAVWDSKREYLLALGSPWQSKVWRYRPKKPGGK